MIQMGRIFYEPMGPFHRLGFWIWWKLSYLFTRNREGSGIYLIRIRKKKYIYVGRSNNIESRWRAHRRKLEDNTHSNDLLLQSYQQYGMRALDFQVAMRAREIRLARLEAAFIRYFQGSSWKLTNEVRASHRHKKFILF